jgi:hypothetical protein
MFRDFRTLLRKKEYRGWRLEEDGAGDFYLSKFDDRFNDDEFRFHLHISETDVNIVKMTKIKSYRKIMKVKEDNEYLQRAIKICSEMTALINNSKRA